MSFDLKLINGDICLGTNGDVAIVENGDKLVQDTLKIVCTPLGSNPFFPNYGSVITSAIVGLGYEPEFIKTIAAQQIKAALENMQQLQQEQLRQNQPVTANEQLAAVQNVEVVQDARDPRYYIVRLTIISKAFQRQDVSFAVPVT